MREITQRNQENGDINYQRVFWAAIIYSIVAASSVGLAFVLLIRYPVWQVYTMAATTVVSFVCDIIAVIFIRQNRSALALKIVYWSGLLTVPINAFLFQGVTAFLAGIVLVTGIVNVYYLFPKSWRRSYQFGPFIAAGLMLVVDFINPRFRIDLGGTSGVFGWVVLVFIVVGMSLIIGRQMWTSGHLRNKIIVMMIGVLTPVLMISTYYNTQSQSKELEEMLLRRAELTAIAGSQSIGRYFEDALESGALSYQQVFDRNYVKFWEFDPAMDPDFDPETDGDPRSYDKYHTTYDFFTDLYWPTIVDSYLTTTDMLYAIPVDINGYLPTHNTRYNSGDGSAANDRTKRIFNDPVGIAAARNTETLLQQVYPRPGTGEILWDVSAPIYVNGEHWGGFRVGVQVGENQSRVIAATWRTIISSAVVVLVLIGFAWFLGQYISEPLEQLTQAVTRAASGDLEEHVSITNRDEITVLAEAFNTMIAQLRDLVTSLEQRIAERTRALETSTEVSRQLSTILDQRDLVREVVEQVRSAFDYYHSQIYLFDETKEELHLAGGTGKAGQTMLDRGHSVPKSRGLVGRAAETNIPVLVPNVERTIGFEIITADTVETVIERESNPVFTETWYTDQITENFTDLQAFAERVVQKKNAGEQTPKLGYILYGLNDFLETVKTGAEKAAQFLGIDVEIVSADFDFEQGIRLFREMIEQKKDGLIVQPDHPEQWVAPIQEAVEAGIPVLTTNLRCPGSASSAWFGQDSYQSGIMLGRELQEALSAAGKTAGKILVASERELHEMHERYAGLQRSLEDSAYTLSEFYNAPLNEQQNLIAWEQLIQSHPDMIAAVGLASVDLPTLVRIKKRTNAQWVAAGYDLSVEILDAIRDGTAQITIGQHPYLQGYLPVLALSQYYIDGTPLKDWIVDGWQSNPLLPKTRAEAAIPISIGENVFGVLDVQDDEVNGLAEADVDLLTSIANQVAIALQNAQAYQRSQQQIAREALMANINQQIQSTTDVEEALQVAVRELGRVLGKDTSVYLQPTKSGNGQKNQT